MIHFTFRLQVMTPIVGLLHRGAEEEEEGTTGEGKIMVPPQLREQIPLPEGEETAVPLAGAKTHQPWVTTPVSKAETETKIGNGCTAIKSSVRNSSIVASDHFCQVVPYTFSIPT
jgi:hypothetical protein